MGSRAGTLWFSVAFFAIVVVAGCGDAAGNGEGSATHASSSTLRAVQATQLSATPAATVVPTLQPTAQPTAAAKARVPEVRVPSESTAFAKVNGLPLVHPADAIARVGFHQASDVNSRDMTVLGSAIRAKVLPTRHRPTAPRSAVDIVVRPGRKIRSPVTGIVKRAGGYNLYCKYADGFIVISPERHPELEVKMLHIRGLKVRPGDRVVAGKTVVAHHANKFPFASQIDRFTLGLAWPHVHMEVTQLAVPDARPTPGRTLAFGNC